MINNLKKKYNEQAQKGGKIQFTRRVVKTLPWQSDKFKSATS